MKIFVVIVCVLSTQLVASGRDLESELSTITPCCTCGPHQPGWHNWAAQLDLNPQVATEICKIHSRFLRLTFVIVMLNEVKTKIEDLTSKYGRIDVNLIRNSSMNVNLQDHNEKVYLLTHLLLTRLPIARIVNVLNLIHVFRPFVTYQEAEDAVTYLYENNFYGSFNFGIKRPRCTLITVNIGELNALAGIRSNVGKDFALFVDTFPCNTHVNALVYRAIQVLTKKPGGKEAKIDHCAIFDYQDSIGTNEEIDLITDIQESALVIPLLITDEEIYGFFSFVRSLLPKAKPQDMLDGLIYLYGQAEIPKRENCRANYLRNIINKYLD